MDVITFGETMVNFAPGTAGPIETVHTFEKRIAGSETNVSVGLARLGHRVAWVSRLGDDGFGRFVYKTVRGEGVDVSGVIFDPDAPTGLYFKEYLGGGRTQVHYYRRGSAASRLRPGDVDLDRFPQARFLFASGITPALSESCRQTAERAIESAAGRGMTVVFDPNMRRKLWSEDEARPILRRLAAASHLVLPGIDEGEILTGSTDAERIAAELLQGRTQAVVVKLGPEGAYYRTVDGQSGYVAGFRVDQVDEIGAGDAFAAGLMSGLLDDLPLPEAVRRACAMGALAVTGIGDYESLPYRRDLEAFMAGVAQATR
ncbi:sugar kinase [Alicyclobacillus sp.]|uniref:sugar kinase n=1 Tax=Alicyclobacillus sp. TaxID=61169 RepID=UPI0025BF03A0|nr:sugar kinase [Alicyclobacillus sp.]MCL6517587.1 sugar kinase [Alicyclobacillus sp.]